MSSGDWIQSVSCRDAIGRPRDVKVQLSTDEIVVVSPPGEITRLNVDESKLLRAALADAELEREKRRPS